MELVKKNFSQRAANGHGKPDHAAPPAAPTASWETIDTPRIEKDQHNPEAFDLPDEAKKKIPISKVKITKAESDAEASSVTDTKSRKREELQERNARYSVDATQSPKKHFVVIDLR